MFGRRMARCSMAGLHCVHPPNDWPGIALCSLPHWPANALCPHRRGSTAGLHCVPCRIAWCPAGGCVTLPDGTVFNRGIVQCSATGEMAIFAICERTFNQERRASARRGSVIRSLCRERRMLFSDERIHDQERRSSARRGSGEYTPGATFVGWGGTLPQSRGVRQRRAHERRCSRGSEPTGG
jgi:hypothetical protein